MEPGQIGRNNRVLRSGGSGPNQMDGPLAAAGLPLPFAAKLGAKKLLILRANLEQLFIRDCANSLGYSCAIDGADLKYKRHRVGSQT